LTALVGLLGLPGIFGTLFVGLGKLVATGLKKGPVLCILLGLSQRILVQPEGIRTASGVLQENGANIYHCDTTRVVFGLHAMFLGLRLGGGTAIDDRRLTSPR